MMVTVEPDRVLQSTSVRGLNQELFPMRLWHKAKKLGVWDPRDLDFSRDAADWRALGPLQQDVLLRLSSLFLAGEESVTLDLLPLIQVIAAEGRLEEEIYLTSFLWEEAKHVELFRRFLDEVSQAHGDLNRYHTPSYRTLFYEELPAALGRLRTDASPAAQARASVTYNLIVEGVMAESGYHGYRAILERHRLMPGMQQAVLLLQRDESRHLAYGVYLLSRLVAEYGEPLWQVVQQRMEELLPPAMGVIQEIFAAYDQVPFGLQPEEFTDFALAQFQLRLDRIEKSRGQSLAEVLRAAANEPSL